MYTPVNPTSFTIKQNITQDVVVAMIRATLQDVLFQLETVNGSKNKCTVEKLGERLNDYITTRERSEQQNTGNTLKHNNRRGYQNSDVQAKSNSNMPTKSINNMSAGHVGSAEALVATIQQSPVQQIYYNQCRC